MLGEKILDILSSDYSVETITLSIALNEPVAVVRSCLTELENKGLITYNATIKDFIIWENWIKC